VAASGDVFDAPDLDEVKFTVGGAGMDVVSVQFALAKDCSALPGPATLQFSEQEDGQVYRLACDLYKLHASMQ
jgi:hypothetical protein